jgi:hypothetical protein
VNNSIWFPPVKETEIKGGDDNTDMRIFISGSTIMLESEAQYIWLSPEMARKAADWIKINLESEIIWEKRKIDWDKSGYCWVKLADGSIELAYYSPYSKRFQVAETVGDYEGLNIDYYDDVVEWMELVKPE